MNILDAEPVKFVGSSEFEDYIHDPLYEVDPNKPGLCWTLDIDDNLDTYLESGAKPFIDVKYHAETRDGAHHSYSGKRIRTEVQ